MKMKMKYLEFRKQLVSGSLAESRPQLAILLSWVLNFTLGMILSTVPLFGSCGPFGIAAAAQAGPELSGLICAVGASCGYLAAHGFKIGMKYVAAVILVFAAGYSMQELKLRNRTFFMPALAAFFTCLTVFLGYYTSEAGKSMVLPLVTETLLSFGCTYFFHEALTFEERMTESAELRHEISVVILAACIMMALSGIKIAESVSLGRIISLLIVQIAAFRGGPLSGATVGIIIGTAMDASSGAEMFYSVAYAVSALISGIFSHRGRLPFILSFFFCCVVCVFSSINKGLRLELLFENLAASVVFMVLPGTAMRRFGAYFRTSQLTTGEVGLRRYTARRIMNMSAAFRDLYSTIDQNLSGGKNDENISSVFDRASEQVCCRCKNKSICWNSKFMDTLSSFNDASSIIKSRGILRREDLPEHFLENCLFPDDLICAVNGELRGLTYRRQYQARISENRSAAYQQYLDLSEVLYGVSEELENAYGPDLLAQRRLNRFLTSMDINADVSVFRDRSGRLHIILESAKLKSLMSEPGYLDRLSDAVGVRLCRPVGSDEKAEGRIMLMEAEPLCVSVGVASMKKSGETVSGDRGTYFKTEQGILCILLSDGMGSGESAAKESVAAVRILERFLRTGMDPALSMRILNSVMLLKNEDSWGFATVDLLCIDLFTGDASFYKYGAAPSYVRACKQIRRVRSKSLAAGLSSGENAVPDMVKMRLRPGNLALIASDGVIAETNDDWIRKLLAESDAKDMKALARDMLQNAVKHYGSTDDMTVLAVRVDKRA